MIPGTDQIIHLRSLIPERNQRLLASLRDLAYALEAKAFGGQEAPEVFSQVKHSHCSAQAVDDSSCNCWRQVYPLTPCFLLCLSQEQGPIEDDR